MDTHAGVHGRVLRKKNAALLRRSADRMDRKTGAAWTGWAFCRVHCDIAF